MSAAAPSSAPPAGHAGATPDDAGALAPDQRVLRQFRQIFNAVKTHFQQVEKQVGLGGAQVWALSVIRDQPGIGSGALARALDIRQPTASNLVRGLAERGLVSTTRDDRDRRAVHLSLLPAGAAVLARCPGPYAGVLPDALAALDAAALARLERDLAVLIRVLGADASDARTPLAQL